MPTFIALLAQDAASVDAQPASLGSTFLPFILIAVVFYFLILRPQSREKAAKEESLSTLKKGDPVVTIGGLCATVDRIDKKTGRVTVKTDDGTRMTFVKAAIDRIDRPAKAADTSASESDDDGEEAESEAELEKSPPRRKH